jgi:hypothetical protein
MAGTIEKRGSILFGSSRGMAGKLASEMIGEGVVERLMPPQTSYQKKRRKELRRLLFNLIRAQSLSRAYGRLITVAVPLRKIYHNEGEYYRISYRSLKAVMEELAEADLIKMEKGKLLLDASVQWKKRCVEEGELKNRMTEVWPTGRLKKEIGEYLSASTHVGADVEMLVNEVGVVLRDEKGGYIRHEDGPRARRMRETVEEVNDAAGRSNVELRLPLSLFGSLKPLKKSSGNGSSPTGSFSADHFSTDQGLSTTAGSLSRLPPALLVSELQCPGHSSYSPPPLSPSSSSISVNTSLQRPQNGIEERIHNRIVRRFPQAWSWKREVQSGKLIYRVPEKALSYKRKFVRGSWDCGGRFYAPVQNVPSEWRRHLRIGGEPVVELDYDNLHVAMLYAEEGKPLDGDAYDITSPYDLGEEMDKAIGLAEEEKALYRRKQRPVVKKALNVLINSKNYQAAYAALKNVDWEEEIGAPIADEAFKPLAHALKEKHRPIEAHLHSDAGIYLQREDSDLAHRIMRKTGAIGIHDGFLIEASREQELKNTMKRTFAEEYDGYDIGVSREFKPLPEATPSS